MNVTVRTILNEPIFKNAKILSGKDFLENKVGRVTVFDCRFTPSVLDDGIIAPGDLFLSALGQFIEQPSQLPDFLRLLSNARSSALFIDSEHLDLITPGIVELCNSLALPIIAFDENIPYAVIIDTINKLTILEFRHAINALWLNRLLFETMSEKDTLDVLHSINPKFDTYMQIIMLQGQGKSISTQNELFSLFSAKNKDCYICYDDIHYFILTDSAETILLKKTNTYKQFLPQFFIDSSMGVSMSHKISDVVLCLKESQLLLNAAVSMNYPILEYASDSILQLILPLKDTPSLNNYRNTFLEKLNAPDSENGLLLFETMKEFVRCKGSYALTASGLNQHENTIRYRINRIRQLFNMEDDPISFYSTISMLAMIESFQ